MNKIVKTIPAAAIALFGAVASAQTTLLEAGAVTAASVNSVTTGGSWALNTVRTGNYVIADDNGDKAFGMDDSNNSIQAKGAWIDDVTIVSGEVAGPSALKILSISKSGTTVSVGFKGTDGQAYHLNKSTNLEFTTPDIRDTETLTGTDTGTLIDDSATEEAAFYRVEQQP